MDAESNEFQEPDLGAMFGGICAQCTSYQEEIQRMKNDKDVAYRVLKEKIICTDKVLMRYNAKHQECEAVKKQLEEAKKNATHANRESEMLSTRLKEALDREQPLIKAKERSERHLKRQTEEVDRLANENKACMVQTEQFKNCVQKMERDIREKDALNKETQSSLKASKTRIRTLEEQLKKSNGASDQWRQKWVDSQKEKRKLEKQLKSAISGRGRKKAPVIEVEDVASDSDVSEAAQSLEAQLLESDGDDANAEITPLTSEKKPLAKDVEEIFRELELDRLSPLSMLPPTPCPMLEDSSDDDDALAARIEAQHLKNLSDDEPETSTSFDTHNQTVIENESFPIDKPSTSQATSTPIEKQTKTGKKSPRVRKSRAEISTDKTPRTRRRSPRLSQSQGSEPEHKPPRTRSRSRSNTGERKAANVGDKSTVLEAKEDELWLKEESVQSFPDIHPETLEDQLQLSESDSESENEVELPFQGFTSQHRKQTLQHQETYSFDKVSEESIDIGQQKDDVSSPVQVKELALPVQKKENSIAIEKKEVYKSPAEEKEMEIAGPSATWKAESDAARESINEASMNIDKQESNDIAGRQKEQAKEDDNRKWSFRTEAIEAAKEHMDLKETGELEPSVKELVNVDTPSEPEPSKKFTQLLKKPPTTGIQAVPKPAKRGPQTMPTSSKQSGSQPVPKSQKSKASKVDYHDSGESSAIEELGEDEKYVMSGVRRRVAKEWAKDAIIKQPVKKGPGKTTQDAKGHVPKAPCHSEETNIQDPIAKKSEGPVKEIQTSVKEQPTSDALIKEQEPAVKGPKAPKKKQPKPSDFDKLLSQHRTRSASTEMETVADEVTKPLTTKKKKKKKNKQPDLVTPPASEDSPLNVSGLEKDLLLPTMLSPLPKTPARSLRKKPAAQASTKKPANKMPGSLGLLQQYSSGSSDEDDSNDAIEDTKPSQNENTGMEESVMDVEPPQEEKRLPECTKSSEPIVKTLDTAQSSKPEDKTPTKPRRKPSKAASAWSQLAESTASTDVESIELTPRGMKSNYPTKAAKKLVASNSNPQIPSLLSLDVKQAGQINTPRNQPRRGIQLIQPQPQTRAQRAQAAKNEQAENESQKLPPSAQATKGAKEAVRRRSCEKSEVVSSSEPAISVPEIPAVRSPPTITPSTVSEALVKSTSSITSVTSNMATNIEQTTCDMKVSQQAEQVDKSLPQESSFTTLKAKQQTSVIPEVKHAQDLNSQQSTSVKSEASPMTSEEISVETSTSKDQVIDRSKPQQAPLASPEILAIDSPSPTKRKAEDEGPAPKRMKSPELTELDVPRVLSSFVSSSAANPAETARQLLLVAGAETIAEHFFQVPFFKQPIAVKMLKGDKDVAPEEYRLLKLALALDQMQCGFVDVMICHATRLLHCPKLRISLETVTHIGRLLGLLCQERNDPPCIGVIVYDLLLTKQLIPLYVIAAVASVWPQLLHADQGGWLINCMKFIVCDILLPNVVNRSKGSNNRHKKLVEPLSSWLGWTSSAPDQLTSQANSMVTGMLASLSVGGARCVEHRMSVALLCKHMEWPWSNNTLIVRHVWPALAMWATGTRDEGQESADGVKDEYAAQLVLLLGLVVRQCPLQHVATTKDVINIIVALHKNKVVTCVHEACVEALLQLATLAPDLIRSTLLPDITDPTLRSQLQELPDLTASPSS